MSMIDGNILLTGYDVVGRVIELIDALSRHDESYVIISDDSFIMDGIMVKPLNPLWM